MKTIITISVICSMMITTAHAVKKCVKIPDAKTCTTNGSNKSTWAIQCGDTYIQGIALCSSKKGTNGETAYSLPVSATAASNSYCWCRMIRPALSNNWVYYYGPYSSGACPSGDCVNACMHHATFDTVLKGLFTNLVG